MVSLGWGAEGRSQNREGCPPSLEPPLSVLPTCPPVLPEPLSSWVCSGPEGPARHKEFCLPISLSASAETRASSEVLPRASPIEGPRQRHKTVSIQTCCLLSHPATQVPLAWCPHHIPKPSASWAHNAETRWVRRPFSLKAG